MPKVIFKFDKEKDLKNNHFAINFISPFEKERKFNMFKKLDETCKNVDYEQCKSHIEKFHSKLYNSEIILSSEQSFQLAWEKINDEFFKRLKNITGNEFPFENVKAYITTQGICPYSFEEGYFMISLWSNIPKSLKTSAHELMHLDFHKNNWEEIEKEIGKEKTNELKEALTILLNLEFKDLWFIKDEGKKNEEQQKLRNFIKREWLKEKNYQSLLDKCVMYLKQ
jgi:hypothetical protein|tara:strand:+ start:366 stop:1040 length:675 start_codon:yes stop_codon:yes gene_type:complete